MNQQSLEAISPGDNNDLTRRSVQQNPFAKAPVTGRGMVTSMLVAAAYAGLFGNSIAQGKPAPAPVLTAKAQVRLDLSGGSLSFADALKTVQSGAVAVTGR